MIETSLNVSDYPTQPELKEKTISGSITLKFDFEEDVPESWSKDEILRHVRDNIRDYFDFTNYEIEEIDV